MKKSRNKVQIDYASKDIFKYYCETTGNPEKLSQAQFGDILEDYWKIIIEKMILDNFELTFPRRLGNLRIVKYSSKPKLKPNGDLDKRKLSVNYVASKKLWKEMYPEMSLEEIYNIKGKPVIYEQNKHTNGYRFMWKWDKRTCLVNNGGIYRFTMCRSNNRLLAKMAKTQKLDFYTS